MDRSKVSQARGPRAAGTVSWWFGILASCGAGGLAVAVAEMMWRGLGPATVGASISLLILLAHVVVGCAAGAALAATLHLAHRVGAVRALGGLPPRVRVLLGVFLGMSPYVAGAGVVWFRELEVRALPADLILLPAIVVSVAWAAAAVMGKLELGARSRVALVGLPAIALMLMMPWVPATATGASAVLENGMFTRMVLVAARSLFDGDGDGYPTRLCAHDCDCEDRVATIHPGAPEVTDNGTDEDCDGTDLSTADLVRLGLVIPPPAPEPESPVAVAGTPSPAAPAWQRRYNVLLIIMDTVRADHLSCQGYARLTTPRIDAFAARSTHFTQARSQGSMTREAMPALLTGRYYAEVSRVEQKWPIILDDNLMVAEMFQRGGYATWAIASFGYFVPLFGYGQGFDSYDTRIPRLGRVHWVSTSDRVTDWTLERIDAMGTESDRPFFIMAHFADPHSGYLRHRESPRFGAFFKDIYDEELFFTDVHIGRLLDGLASRGLMEDTIVVLTSDHGEGLDREEDHGHLYHGQRVYDNLIHVPLIVWAPVAGPRRIDVPVATIDVVPTLLELTGLETDEPLRGVSLAPWIRGDTMTHPPVFSQKVQPAWREQVAMVDWPHKVVWFVSTNRWELFHLPTDANERRNLARDRPDLLETLSAKVRAWRSTLQAPAVLRRKRGG